MGEIVHYDNEQDMRAMVNDTVEFIMSETRRLAETFGDQKNDPNIYLMLSQSITLTFVLNLLKRIHLNNEMFMASFDKSEAQRP